LPDAGSPSRRQTVPAGRYGSTRYFTAAGFRSARQSASGEAESLVAALVVARLEDVRFRRIRNI